MKEKTISPRQAGMLCTVLIFANKISLLPSLLYEGAKADGFFSIILMLIIELGVLGIFFFLKLKYPNATIGHILEGKLGKVVTKLVFIFLMAFFLFKLLTTYAVGYIYLKQQVYQKDFALLAFICFIPVINHAVVKGLRTFARTIELYYYIVLVGIFICLAIGLSSFKGFPLFFDTALPDFFLTTFKHIFAFGDYLFLFIIMDKIQLDKKGIKQMSWYIATGIILLLAIVLIYYSLFQITAFMHNNALADIITSSVQYGAIGRLDVVAMITRMFLTIFEMEIFHFGFSEAFCVVFPKSNHNFSVFVFDVIFTAIYVVLIGRFENVIFYTREWLPYFAIVTNYFIPIVFLIIALVKNKKRAQKNEKDC